MKIMYQRITNLLIICFIIGTTSVYSQVKTYKGELYTVVYSEDYQQPLQSYLQGTLSNRRNK